MIPIDDFLNIHFEKHSVKELCYYYNTACKIEPMVDVYGLDGVLDKYEARLTRSIALGAVLEECFNIS